jgi:hypothetical protein
MKKMSTFRLAFWSGVFAEIIACGSFTNCFGYGSATPGHASESISHFIYMFQMPGLWLGFWLAAGFARFMPIIGIRILPFMVLGGLTQFVILFWVGISLWRRLHGRNTSA